MYKIVQKKELAEKIFYFEVEAPRIALKRKPGQFVLIRIDEQGERIPLTIADADKEKGRISFIFQVVGSTTEQMSGMREGEYLLDVVGPLGNPTHIEKFGTVVCIGGGLGIALIYPLVRAMSEAGNRVISIISARDKSLLILEKELKNLSEEVKIATDDGSCGYKGFPMDILKGLIEEGAEIDLVAVVGPAVLMKAVAEITREHNIKTIASLNSLIVDGTGMCGGCRVKVNGRMRFTCVDGPEFDAHQVDFDSLIQRLSTYQREEREGKKVSFPEDSEDFCKIDLAQSEIQIEEGTERQPASELPAQIRRKTFSEVSTGYTKEAAGKEAVRCLQCRKPVCRQGCPVGIDIPAFIQLIKDNNPIAAAEKIKETSCLPAVCGRVCPAEDQCEKRCVLGINGEPVAIGNLERFATDCEREAGPINSPHRNFKDAHHLQYKCPEGTQIRTTQVAIVGSGPAGITAARDLAVIGYKVSVFEAFHKPGGVLIYGIPEFRLPNAVVQQEVDYLKSLGVEINLNSVIGKLWTVDELFGQGFSAVFIATGAGLPRFMGIPGEDLNGVFSANEYLTRVNLMCAYDSDYKTPIPIKKRATVIGGGNVAMDSARTAIRLGSDVTLIYRRSQEEMPCRPIERHHAQEEGLKLQFLTNPVKILGDEKGWVRGLECVRMELGEADESGRRRPIPIKGSEFVIDTDMVIEAVGTGPNPLVPETTPELKLNKRGYIEADKETFATSREGVYAGGDIVSGSATVILAMGAGRGAASAIDAYLEKL